VNGIFAFILGFLSLITGWLVRVELPQPLATWSCKVFASLFGIDLSLAEQEIDQFKNIEELFTRRLKPSLRPALSTLVSPADGSWTQSALASGEEMAVQVKGKFYSLSELTFSLRLGEDFSAKWYSVFYLSPKDYHRVHASTDASLVSITYMPGALWPVNRWAVQYVPELFVSNERLVFEFRDNLTTEIYFLVMVGALNVGRMRTPFWPGFETNTAMLKETIHHTPRDPVEVKAGQEVGTFSLGSTVVLVAGAKFLNHYRPRLFTDTSADVKVGQTLL
jgi:phosphatidylserine decarboxylase